MCVVKFLFILYVLPHRGQLTGASAAFTDLVRVTLLWNTSLRLNPRNKREILLERNNRYLVEYTIYVDWTPKQKNDFTVTFRNSLRRKALVLS